MPIQSCSAKLLSSYTGFLAREKKKCKTKRIRLENPMAILNKGQRKAVAIVKNSLADNTPLHMLVLGVAGTGKSFVLNSIRSLISEKRSPSAVLVVGPTGVSSNYVDGETVHSAFRIPFDYCTENDPSDEELRKQIALCKLEGVRSYHRLKELLSNQHKKRLFKKRMKEVEFIIIDEFSMISLQMLGYIDKKLKDVSNSKALFGNKSVVMFGDIGQICPVGGTPLFGIPNPGDLMAIRGAKVYSEFKTVIYLDECVRQSGKDQKQFRDLLGHVRNGTLNQEDINLLNSRTLINLSESEQKEFIDADYLFRYNKDVNIHNLKEMERLDIPKVKIELEDLSYLECSFLGIGAKIMLLQNLWTERGLVNGATGVVESILYEEGKTAPCMPVVVNVKFDKYAGPFPKGETSVPITPVVLISNALKGEKYRELPIRLAYSSSVHKSQARTIPKLVVNFKNCFNLPHSLVYVALSRAPKLSSIALAEPLSLNQLDSKNDQLLKSMLKEEKRLRELSVKY